MSECHQCGSHSLTGQLTKYQSSELRTRTSLASSVGKKNADEYLFYLSGDLSNQSNVVANNVNRFLGSKNDGPKKISFLCDNDSSYINTLFGIWRAGHVAVPLCKTHPSQNLEYYVKDSESVAVIASKTQINKVIPFTENLKTCELLSYEEIIEATESYPSIDVSHVSVYFQF